MSELSLREASGELFREVFEGVAPGADGTYFVQGKEAIFDAVRSISAAEASRRVAGQPSSIGAHAYHLNYYLSLFNADLRGESPEVDWEGSWKHQGFDDASWAALIADMEAQFAFARAWYVSETPSKESIYSLSNVAHAAYHLGAIRALLPIVKAIG